MKKTISVILTVLMTLSLVSCSGAQINGVNAGSAAAGAPETDINSDNAENTTDEEYYGPDDFVQYQSGKLEFKDYDEIIACLLPGQGWTKIEVLGCDGDVGTYTGFLRPSNDFGDDKEFTGDKEKFDSMIEEMNSKPVLIFTEISK